MNSQTRADQRHHELVRGAYDLHVHSAPDIILRSQSDIMLARAYQVQGVRGCVIKSHHHPTVARAELARELVDDVDTLGSVTLNSAVGGLNAVSVDVAARLGAKVVWLPTIDARNDRHVQQLQASSPFWVAINAERSGLGINTPWVEVVDAQGQVLPQMLEVFTVIKAHNLVLATGHLAKTEIMRVVKAAQVAGLTRIIITHPDLPAQGFSVREQCELAERGVWIEHTLNSVVSGKADVTQVLTAIREVGPTRTLLTSDFGKPSLPAISEGMALWAKVLLEAGFSEDSIHELLVKNSVRCITGNS